jgi:4-amino-4-deoxy-L-arabinose transferase-like glycosyltransferase
LVLDNELSLRDRGLRVFCVAFVLAFGLRAVLLGQHAFQMDEAAIASWSDRIAHGDLLLTGGLRNDKPPLQMYLGAVGIALFGHSESAVRLMDAGLSALECGLLAWALVPLAGTAAALGSGLLLASSPLARAYGASGIMDGPLSFFRLLSVVMALRGRPGFSGAAWALAFCCKQTALFLLPWPLLAVLAVAPAWWPALKAWAWGAAGPVALLMAWELSFAHPRLGAFVGMAAGQPEVGLRLGGLGERLGRWLQVSAGDLPWAPALPWLALAGPVAGLVLLWKARSAEARAWALTLGFPLYGMAVFAALNMRYFDRYVVPFAWSLCAAPAVLVAAWPVAGRLRRAGGLACLGLGLAALVWIRFQPLPSDSQGAAGSVYDGYRALLLDVQRREPQGGVLVSGQGGLRQMGAWYMDKSWRLVESPEAPAAAGAPLYAAEREGSPPEPGTRWQFVARYDAFGPAPYWLLYKAEP